MRWALVGCVILALAGCGGSSAPAPAPSAGVVPDVVGRPRTEAACLLVAARLRWTEGTDKHVFSRPPVPCHQGELRQAIAPDPKVTEQDPTAGTRLAPGSVVALEDECTRLPPNMGCV